MSSIKTFFSQINAVNLQWFEMDILLWVNIRTNELKICEITELVLNKMCFCIMCQVLLIYVEMGVATISWALIAQVKPCHLENQVQGFSFFVLHF